MALPVLLVLGTVAVFLLLPDPPAPLPSPIPQPLDNGGTTPWVDDGDDPLPADPDLRPRPRPNNGAPDDASVADAMLEEAWSAMGDIRSRLELKYKYAEYTLDRSVTLAALMRKLERLDGKYFRGTDYALHYPEGSVDTVRIECVATNGRALPDGALAMIVDMRTGETQVEGTVFARNAEGYVLLGDEAYRELSRVFRESVLAHYNLQQNEVETLVAVTRLVPEDIPEPFQPDDFKATAVGSMGYRLSCSTVRGEPLAKPVGISADYTANTISVTGVASDDWMRPPDDRERLKNRIDGLLDEMAHMALDQLKAGTKVDQLRIYLLGGSWWYFRWAELSPFDVKLAVIDGESPKVTLTVETAFGRSLPFKAVRFVATSAESEGSYID